MSAAIEAAARQLAADHGYGFGKLSDGTIVLEPPPDPECCAMCAEAAGKWMSDCIDHYWRTEKRGPSTGELLAWREADASCRMERDL